MTFALFGNRNYTTVLLIAGLSLLLLAPLGLSDFRVGELAKFLCFAMVAIGINLVWGYGGMLTLGQGVFFGLGAYSMGMYMKLSEVGDGELPDFMVWSGETQLPVIWQPFQSPFVAVAASFLVPMTVAYLVGRLVFQRRIRGAYFALITQALAAALVIWMIGQQGLTGGTNGLTNFTTFFGLNLRDEADRRVLYYICLAALVGIYLLSRQLVNSRWGRLLLACRDAETRVRFLGYNPARVKTTALVISAGMAGLAGALFVPVVGIVSPTNIGVLPSIEMVVWVAIGGRATLAGPIIGALVVSYAKSLLSESYPDFWLYFQGAIFALVVGFVPRGIPGVPESIKQLWLQASPKKAESLIDLTRPTVGSIDLAEESSEEAIV